MVYHFTIGWSPIKFGAEVKRLRYLPVTEYGAGSTPVGPAIRPIGKGIYPLTSNEIFQVRILVGLQ